MAFGAGLRVVNGTKAARYGLTLFEDGTIGIVGNLINEPIANTALRVRRFRPQGASSSNGEAHEHDDFSHECQNWDW